MRYLIEKVSARQILDSRGTPTVEARVLLSGGYTGVASVPSGASTGAHEACELRDGAMAYGGKGVLRAVEHVNGEICRLLRGMDALDQYRLDGAMIELDGTRDKSRLGANAMLAVSLACAHAAARATGQELFRYLGGVAAREMPVPMMNILNGGAHADNNVDIQEFMIRPVGADSFESGLGMCVETYKALGKLLGARAMGTAVGDEGGFAPNLARDEEALGLIVQAIERAGYRPGEDVTIALDVAATGWLSEGAYVPPKRGARMDRDELMKMYVSLCGRYPIDSIEDPFAEDDFEAFALLTHALEGRVQIVGDDLFTTNPDRIRRGIQSRAANAALIKPNQIGTLSETVQAVHIAQSAGYRAILSHRSGETEDTSIADIAVALNAGQIKAGAPARTDRTAKYNRLLRIESILRGGAL